MSAGQFHTVAIKTDGTLWAWGYNFSGQLGDGTYTSPELSPEQIGSDTNRIEVSAGQQHTAGLN